MIIQLWDAVELAFVYFFYVETRGPTLEELAKIFDGEDAEVAHIDINDLEKDVQISDEQGEMVGSAGGKQFPVVSQSSV